MVVLRRCLFGTLLLVCAGLMGVGNGSSAQAPAGIVVRVGASVSQVARWTAPPADGEGWDHEPRFQVTATSLSSAQVFGIDVEGVKGGDERTFDAGVLGYPLESSLTFRPASTRCRRCCTSTRRSVWPPDTPSSCRWIAARASNGTARPATSIVRRKRCDGRADVAARFARVDQGDPGAEDACGHEVRQARAHPQRAAVEVLGPRHVPRRARPAAGRLRHPPERALPAHHQPRALPARSRRLARNAAGPEREMRVQRALSARLLQPHPAAGGLRLLQGMDRARTSRACW